MRIIFFLLITLLFGCQPLDTKSGDKKTVGKEALCNEISRRVALKLMKDRGLIPCGSGGGTINQVRMLALSFDYRKPLTIEGGRELILTAIHEFTDAINADERIRPYLESYPFEPERVEIRIFVQDSKGGSVPLSAADIFSCCGGVCQYKQFNVVTRQLNIFFTETLAEAEQKAQEYVLQTSIAQ